MRDLHDIARRFVVGHMYLLYLGRPTPRLGYKGLPATEVTRVRSGLELMRHSGLVPQAELITVEAAFESFDDQPADVRSVLLRLVEEAEHLAGDLTLLQAVAEHRRTGFPGVLEEPEHGSRIS